MDIGGSTRVFALLGDPVAHSLSPRMQNAGFRALGIDAVYVPIRCQADELSELMTSLARQGGGGNVTIPHKVAAARVLSNGGPTLSLCNTFWGREGKVAGGETDSGAILSVLQSLGGFGRQWLLLGTGGSAHAALLAAKRAGARIAVRSRSVEHREQLEAEARAEGIEAGEAVQCDVVLNCTPLGLQAGDPLPVEPDAVPGCKVALDLVYRRGETDWVRAMRAAGRVAADGRGILLEQGAAAFELWFPDRSAPREVMGAALRSALE